jgi:hypothetical protein
VMVSHRRPGVLARLLRRPGSPPDAAVLAPRRAGVELVDASTKLAHRVSLDELVAGHRRGDYLALCGARFPAASLVEAGRGRCRGCGS